MLLTPTAPGTTVDPSTAAAETLAEMSALDEARAIDLLHTLVAMPSVSGGERPATELLTARMHELGFRTRIDEVGNAIGEIGCTASSAREIVLLGHIDTVPGEVRVRREGDLLYGRGAVDAKGPLAAFVMAAATTPLPPGVRVVVIGAVEEETATSRGARHISKRPPPYACIIGEPSGDDGVVLGYKGRLLMDATVTTPSAHSAGPAENAAELAVAWWERVRAMAEEFNRGRGRQFDRLQVRLKSFRTTEDGLADRADAVISFRLPTDLSPDVLEARMRRLLASDGPAGVRLRFSGHEEAVLSDRTNPVARALTVAIRAGGRVPRPTVKTGTSDMNVVGPMWRCPISAYGPGDSSLDHTPNEHISIPEYLEAIGVLRRALRHLASDQSGD